MRTVCVCSERAREGLNGSNGFNCHNRITEINWGLATHLDYRAQSPGLEYGAAEGSKRTHIHICALVKPVNPSLVESYWLKALPSQ